MTQDQIDRLVARATGEPLSEIRHRGFGLDDPLSVEADPELLPAFPNANGSAQFTFTMDGMDEYREPLTVDWDELEASREVLYPVY